MLFSQAANKATAANTGKRMRFMFRRLLDG
jgi:hypothetical protein